VPSRSVSFIFWTIHPCCCCTPFDLDEYFLPSPTKTGRWRFEPFRNLFIFLSLSLSLSAAHFHKVTETEGIFDIFLPLRCRSMAAT
jgi:hypothetical protein